MLKRLTHQVRSFESVWADVCSGDDVIFVGEHFHILFHVVASSAGDCQWSASYSRWLKGEVLSWGNYQRLAGMHLGVGLGHRGATTHPHGNLSSLMSLALASVCVCVCADLLLLMSCYQEHMYSWH